MKKTLMTCLAILALFALASGASAITCTVDQRPAATLLVPYFAASFNADGTPLSTGPAARNTIVTIGNASAAPMIAHVTVFNERSALVLDFNIALTGFDIQTMSMASILAGSLPATPIDLDHAVADGAPVLPAGDACQRNPGANVYPDPAGFLRIRPVAPATPQDNTLATTIYPSPAWPPGSPFAFQVLDSLDETPDSFECDGGVDGDIEGLIHGYVTIDHANYCNLSNPSDPAYYSADAIGMENNLWGEVIFTSGAGLPTYGGSTVNIEADPSLSAGTPPTDPITENIRTFYARYVSADTFCNPANCALFVTNPWNQGVGDQREPLGLKYAARWFDTGGVESFFTVWRASSNELPAGPFLADLIAAGDCDDVEPVVTLVFYDEDENTVTSGVCPSPCDQPQFNIPLETQRVSIRAFSHPDWPAGWVSMSFFNASGPNDGDFDQAWVEYDFEGASAFLSISAPGTQLDPSSCNPLGTATTVIAPVIPAIVGTGP